MAVVCDLNGIKTQIAALFTAANTTTASPVYLSNGMTTKVNKILKLNPNMIPPQISFYPFVTCYVTKKTVVSASMAKDQLSGQRKAQIEMEVVGGILNQNFSTDTEDPADEDITLLMENIELTLRGSPNLNSTVLWQVPREVSYYSAAINETTHLRAGILTLEGTVFY